MIFVLQIGQCRGLSRDSDSDDDIPDELKADFVDERTGEMPPQRKWVFLLMMNSGQSRTREEAELSALPLPPHPFPLFPTPPPSPPFRPPFLPALNASLPSLPSFSPSLSLPSSPSPFPSPALDAPFPVALDAASP